MADVNVSVGARVLVRDKDVRGTVSYVGVTDFAPGKWIGLTLDEPKGKNDGSVQGKAYFVCEDKYGMFVRPNHIVLIDDETASNKSGSDAGRGTPTPGHSPAKDKSPTESKLPGPKKAGGIPTPSAIPKSRLPTPGSGPTGGRSPSFTNLKTSVRRESTAPSQSGLQRERSFVERNFVETLKQPQIQVQQPQEPMTPPAHPTVSKLQSAAQSSSAAPPSPAAQALSDRIEEKMANIQNQQDLNRAKEEITDLKEKLETIKIKRAKDQEKIKEYEKIRIQHEQLVEFKSRIMEAHAALQKELTKAKHEAREAIEAKERHAEEMAELSETVEMATLDKEMAEERAETLQLELEAAKEKIEELQLDLDIIKTEMGEDGGGGGGGQSGDASSSSSNYEMKQLAAQNEKLRDTLVKMRDLSAHEKSEIMRLTKDLEEKQHQNTELTRVNEKLKSQNESLEATISDLQEQVDAALGAEEMVENLTTKCLDLEDQYSALLEEKQDLEALHDMNEELQENAREVELELREELDLAYAKLREEKKGRNTAYEIIADHETTIQKFRHLVSQVQEQNQSLRDALEKETKKPVSASSAAAEMIDFKKMFAETKAHSRAIDLEMRQCEVEESRRHVKILSSFMSDNFMSRGGDNEAVLVLLLIPRLMWKINILETQVKEKFVSTDQAINKSSLLKNPSASSAIERLNFGQSVLHNLNCLNAILEQYETALNTCDPTMLLRVGTLFPEMSVHEKSIDFYIELLRKDQLDENVPLENLEKSLNYFQQIYPMHLGCEKINHTNVLNNHIKVFSSATDCLSVAISLAKALSPSVESYDGELGSLVKAAENDVGEIRQTLKSIRRRIPLHHDRSADHRLSTEPVIVFPMAVAKDLIDVAKNISQLTKAFHLFSRSCIQQALILTESESSVPVSKLSEFLHHALDQAFESSAAYSGFDLVKSTMAGAVQKLTGFGKSLHDGEYDMDPAAAVGLWNTVPPILIRAEAYKTELKDAETLKYKLENKELDIRELKKAIKAKTDEMSEMQIRKDKAEKRLIDATRDADLMREKLQRKLEDTEQTLLRKEKEYNDTLDHLQSELDNLESERGELRLKLKETTKKVLLEGISRQGLLSAAGQSGGGSSSGALSLGPSVPNPIKDSPLLLQQVHELQNAISSLKQDAYRRKGEDLRQRVSRLKPLTLPKRLVRIPASTTTTTLTAEGDASGAASATTPEMSEKRDISKEEAPSIDDLSKNVLQLRQKISAALVAKEVVQLSSKHSQHQAEAEASGSLLQLDQIQVGSRLRDKKLELETDRLQMEIVRLMATRKPGGLVESDLCRFPSRGLSQALSEKDYTVVGRVRIPSSQENCSSGRVPILINPRDLQLIHQKVIG